MNVDDNLVSGPRILVSLQYNDTEEILTVTIHRAVDLPSGKYLLVFKSFVVMFLYLLR